MNILTRLRSPLLATAPSDGRQLIISKPTAVAVREQARIAKPSSSVATTSPASQPLVTGVRRNDAAAEATKRKALEVAATNRLASIAESWKRAHARAQGKHPIRAAHGWDKAHARARAQRSENGASGDANHGWAAIHAKIQPQAGK